MWIGQTRGREFSSTHKTLILPDQEAQYWNYSFEEIGTDDIPALVNGVIANRVGAGKCNKVSLLAHSSGLSAALVAGIKGGTGLTDRVGQINGVAPCIKLNLSKFVLPDVRDLTSVQAFYDILGRAGMTNLFGPQYATDIQKVCDLPTFGAWLCDNYFSPAIVNPDLKQLSVKGYRHIHQNTIQGMLPGQGFYEYRADETDPAFVPYDLSAISLPVKVLYGSNDIYCSPQDNLPFFSSIPNVTLEEALGAANRDFCVYNDVSMADQIGSLLPQAAIPVLATNLCPADECKKSDPECKRNQQPEVEKKKKKKNAGAAVEKCSEEED